ncbi:M23 family metallopeptidase [Thermodesulfitimonas autotrophica]|uniref:M23 family metallopeptidase n=1 Tax=Thermodesulfitimonas autotrophica TaxID=1894989 RepID=UPI002FE4287D
MRRSSVFIMAMLLLLTGVVSSGQAVAQPDEWLGAAPEPAAPVLGLPTYYRVAAGDTLCGIARRYGVGAALIARANGLSLSDPIYAGQYLVVPTGGFTHRVVPGDTLWDIACRYGVAIEELARVNGLDTGASLLVGTALLVPVSLDAPETRDRGDREPLSWPVLGPVSSPFGLRDGRPHEGIDIAAPAGAPVRAAAGGQVVYAGPAGTYGLLVILRHDAARVTYYAHCSAVYVVPGQTVAAGEVIAAVGNTGRSTGPHLHFEVRVNGTPCDPVPFLRG